MIFTILYQAFVIWLAYKNAEWSNPTESYKIKHWLNGLCHLTAAGLIGWFFGWQYSVSLLLFTRVVFDASMNLFRHYGLGYISPRPESVLDKLEKKFIIWLTFKIYRRRYLVSETDIERVAIYFRVLLLVLGILFLII